MLGISFIRLIVEKKIYYSVLFSVYLLFFVIWNSFSSLQPNSRQTVYYSNQIFNRKRIILMDRRLLLIHSDETDFID